MLMKRKRRMMDMVTVMMGDMDMIGLQFGEVVVYWQEF